MIPYIGDFAAGAVVRHVWNSTNSNGASITRATNGTVTVYKDLGTTEDGGDLTDSEDFDTIVGCHAVSIDTSIDTTFYAVGHDYHVMLQNATIDGQTVNGWLFAFSIQNRATTPATVASAVAANSTISNMSTNVGNLGTELGKYKSREATAQGGGVNYIDLDSSASATDSYYNGASVRILSGTGAGQRRFITAYVGSTKRATVDANWTVNPDSSSVFIVE